MSLDLNLDDLYQEIILDHAKRPRHFGPLADATASVHADNPMCGDEVDVHLKLGADGKVEALNFTGNACSICTASASLMTGKLLHKSPDECRAMSQQFQQMLKGESTPPKEFGDLKALAGVRKFPQRVKCATLAWHAVEDALKEAGQ